MKQKKIVVVARSFQKGKDLGNFNREVFEKHAIAFKNIIGISEIDHLVVVTCGGGKFSEIETAGKFPTEVALAETFPLDVAAGKIIPHVCRNWGDNPGSSNALNDGMNAALNLGASFVLNWSPEIECDLHIIYDMLRLAEYHNLACVGAYRQNWWERPQWAMPQNTLALWNISRLLEVGGFAPECNGTGRTVETKEYGKASLAGMEDFHALLRIMKADIDGSRNALWGMIRKSNPLKWEVNFEGERLQNHLIKVARQRAVMQTYAADIFPDTPFGELMDFDFFARSI